MSVLTLNDMRAEWTGDPRDLVGMVGTLAPTIATEDDLIAKANWSGPVQRYLREHGPATIEEIVEAFNAGEEGVVPVALAVNMHRELGLIVSYGDHRWGYPANVPGAAAAAFGLEPEEETFPNPFFDETDTALAEEIRDRVMAVFDARPGQDLAMADIGPAAQVPPEDAVALLSCLDRLQEEGKIIRSGERYGAGPTWRLP